MVLQTWFIPLQLPHVCIQHSHIYCLIFMVNLKFNCVAAETTTRPIIKHLSICSYPLLHIPLPGTIPTKIVLPYESPSSLVGGDGDASMTAQLTEPSTISNNNLFQIGSNLTFEQQPFPWASSDPFVYIQQIVLRTSVIPWKKNLLLTDAYRGPLHEIFKLLEIVRNHEDDASKTNLANICLHVENVKMPNKYPVFPEYNCLTLSPANLWQQNAQNFKKDTNLLSTIFHHHVRPQPFHFSHPYSHHLMRISIPP